MLLNRNRTHLEIVAQGKFFPTLKELFNMGLTFSLTLFAWIFFRARNVEIATGYISKIFSRSFFTVPSILPLTLLVLIGVFVLIEWIGREKQYALQVCNQKMPLVFRWSIYYAISFLILIFSGIQQQFIYIQF